MRLFSFHSNLVKNKMIIENIRGIMLFFDREGRITDHNALAMKELGYQMELQQCTVQEIFKNTVLYENRSLKILSCLERPEEATAYRKNQTCFPVELKISIYNKGRSFVGLCIARNITEHKDNLQKMEQMVADIASLEHSRNEIAANVTHELRTPVNGILGVSNNLLDTELQPNQIEMVHLIKHCCNNMEAIINDLLDYAKLSNQKMILEQREFCLREAINSVVNFNRPLINDKGLNFFLYIADDIPKQIIGDELRLSQILNNLLSNAVKFTSVGNVSLEVAKLSQSSQSVELFFMVIDTGIGISAENKDKLFQSFTQVDGSITRRFGGTGLGLAISKKLVEAMGGTIGVDSEKGKGSTFSFSVRVGLPMHEQELNNRSDDIILNDINYYKDLSVENVTSDVLKGISNIKYIDRLLKEAGNSVEVPETQSKDDIYIKITPALEKLSICIEMESWDKAEELASYIRNQLTPEFGDVTKIVFRLLLSVRKENYETSIAIMNELKTFLGR